MPLISLDEMLVFYKKAYTQCTVETMYVSEIMPPYQATVNFTLCFHERYNLISYHFSMAAESYPMGIFKLSCTSS